MPKCQQNRSRYTAPRDCCCAWPFAGSLPIRLAGLIRGHAKSVTNLVPTAAVTAGLCYEPGDLFGRDFGVVPCQADSGQVGHILAYRVRILAGELVFDVVQLLSQVVTLAHLPSPPSPAGRVSTTPPQTVKVDDCLVGGVFGIDADLNIAA